MEVWTNAFLQIYPPTSDHSFSISMQKATPVSAKQKEEQPLLNENNDNRVKLYSGIKTRFLHKTPAFACSVAHQSTD